MLELMRRVVLRVRVTCTSCHLRSLDLLEGEWEWLCFFDPWDLGDLWVPEDTSLEWEVFLAVVESGHFGVVVVELHPELQ